MRAVAASWIQFNIWKYIIEFEDVVHLGIGVQ